jgi:hypothetical protein
VHLLYVGLSRRWFELDTPIGGWPERSWAFSGLFDGSTTRSIASVLYMMAIIIFVLSGLSHLFEADWWKVLVVSAAVFSSIVIFLCWDGKFQQLPDKGFIGVLINVAIVGAVVRGQ